MYFLLAGSDYTPVSTPLTFTSGETIGSTRCVTVDILDDSVVESAEMFTILLLSDGLTQTINTTSANVTIYEDDSDGKLFVDRIVIWL